MSDVSVQIDSTVGNAICEWCSALYQRITHNGKYCSNDCRREVVNADKVGRYHTEYPPSRLEKKYLDYKDYPNENSQAIAKYGIKPPTPRDGSNGRVYQVPELNFRRFKETKKIIVFTSDQEVKRNGWV